MPDVLFFEIGSIISDRLFLLPVTIKKNSGEILKIPRCIKCGGWGIGLIQPNMNMCNYCHQKHSEENSSKESVKRKASNTPISSNKKTKSLVSYG